MRVRGWLWPALAAGMLMGIAAGPVTAQLAIEVGDTEVTARGVAPGTAVAWLAVQRQEQSYHAAVTTLRELVEDADGDGAVSLQVDSVPWKSLWLAVSLATGEVAVGAPEGFWAEEISLPVLVDVDGEGHPGSRLRLARSWTEMLLARPGVGAWGASLREGGEGDDDGASNSELAADVGRLSPLGSLTEGPQGLRPGDVVVIVIPDALQYAIFTPGGRP